MTLLSCNFDRTIFIVNTFFCTLMFWEDVLCQIWVFFVGELRFKITTFFFFRISWNSNEPFLRKQFISTKKPVIIFWFNTKSNNVRSKTQFCDPRDIKSRDRFLEAIFAYDNPSPRLLASLNEPAKLAQTRFGHLKRSWGSGIFNYFNKKTYIGSRAWTFIT